MAAMPMHAGELPISADVARDLVGTQFPQWRDLSVSRVASPGTVNAIFRIGDRLAARFPLQGTDPAAARRLLESEGAAARELAGATRFPVPGQVALGEPGPGYPLPWSVQAWLPGSPRATPPARFPSPATWRSSSPGSGRSAPAAGYSAAGGAAAT